MFGLGGTEGGVLFVLFAIVFFFVGPFFINASLAKSRGKSVALVLLLTCIFSWIVTLLLAIMPKVELQSTTKQCLFCAEDVRKDAIKCKHCGGDLPSTEAEPKKEETPPEKTLAYKAGKAWVKMRRKGENVG